MKPFGKLPQELQQAKDDFEDFLKNHDRYLAEIERERLMTKAKEKPCLRPKR